MTSQNGHMGISQCTHSLTPRSMIGQPEGESVRVVESLVEKDDRGVGSEGRVGGGRETEGSSRRVKELVHDSGKYAIYN